MKAESSKSLTNFLWDIFIRSFECKEALYEDCSALNDDERSRLIASYLKNIDIWKKIYNSRLSYIRANIRISDGQTNRPASDIFFHPRFGWVVSNGGYKAFLGKVSFSEDVKVSIGQRSYFSGSGIVRGEDLLQIGSYCCIAEGCYINVLADCHPVDYPSLYGFNTERRLCEDKMNLPVKYHSLDEAKSGVTIGNDVWFGRNVRIVNGTNIANGCVIAEGSLVRRDCEPYGIYGGTPAKLIRYRFSEHIIEQLLEIKWWNWPFDKIRKNVKFIETDLTTFKGSLSDIIENDG